MVGWGVRVVVVAGRWMELGKNKIVQYLQSVKTVSLFLIHIAACTVLALVPGSPFTNDWLYSQAPGFGIASKIRGRVEAWE